MKQLPDLNLTYDFERDDCTDAVVMKTFVAARQGLMKEIIESFGEVNMGEVENKLCYSTSYDVDDGSKTITERNNDDIITGLLRFANAVGLDNFGGDGKWANAVETMAAWYVANVHQYSQAIFTFCPLVNREVRWDCSGFTTACLWLYGALQNMPWPPTSTLYTSDDSVGAKLSAAGFAKMTFSWDIVQPYDIITYPGHVEIYNGLINGKHTSWAWGACHDTAHGGLPCCTAHQKQGYDVIWRNKYNGTATFMSAIIDYNGAFDGKMGSAAFPLGKGKKINPDGSYDLFHTFGYGVNRSTKYTGVDACKVIIQRLMKYIDNGVPTLQNMFMMYHLGMSGTWEAAKQDIIRKGGLKDQGTGKIIPASDWIKMQETYQSHGANYMHMQLNTKPSKTKSFLYPLVTFISRQEQGCNCEDSAAIALSQMGIS